MKKQELYKRLRKYDKNTEIKIGYIDYRNGVYYERPLNPQDIMISNYCRQETIIFYPLLDTNHETNTRNNPKNV